MIVSYSTAGLLLASHISGLLDRWNTSMLRVAARRSATAPRLSLLGVRHRSTEGPVEAKITSQHPTHKDKDEKVLAKAREIARDVASGKQSPNREVVWSNSQQPRQMGMRGPRFEQTEIDKQVS